MSVTSGALVATGAPERGDGLPTVVPLPAPKVLVRQTRTAGWQVCYVALSGRVIVEQRRLSQLDAMLTGAAMSRVRQCPIEVAQ